MKKRRNAVVVGVVALSATMVPAAWAGHPGPHSTGHDQTATVSCSGGSSFVVDANAFFGQQTETAAFNAAPPEDTCQVNLDQP
jgi:hypothetical protein